MTQLTLHAYWFLLNLIFLLKYSPGSQISSMIFAIGLSSLTWTWLRWSSRVRTPQTLLIAKIFCFSALFLAIILHLVLLIKVDKLGVTVDRWSALEYFWKGLFNGEFPYAVSTHIDNGNTPSPLPIWQVISLPFVLIGDVGLIQVFILGIFSGWVYRSHQQSFLKYLPFILLSPAYWYEALTRSDLSSCIILGIACMVYLKSLGTRHLFASMCLLGLAMSTRTIFIIPFTILMVQIFKSNPLKGLQVLIGSLGVFFMTFLPFILWDGSLFLKYNPMILNGNKSGSILITFAFGAAILLGWRLNQIRHVYYSAGLLILGLAAIPFFLVLWEHGLMNSLLENRTDIVYLGLAMPFILYAEALNQVEIKT